MRSIMDRIITKNTQIGITFATLATVIIAALVFGSKLWWMEASFSYMKADIEEIKENQVTMPEVKLAINEAIEKKK